MAFNAETLSPTCELLWGIPGRSNALAIATPGLDRQVLDQAQELLAPAGDGEVNSVIRGLEEQRLRQQSAAEDAAALLARELLHEGCCSAGRSRSRSSNRPSGRSKDGSAWRYRSVRGRRRCAP